MRKRCDEGECLYQEYQDLRMFLKTLAESTFDGNLRQSIENKLSTEDKNWRVGNPLPR